MKEDGVQVCAQLWVSAFSNPRKTYTNLTGFLKKFDLWVLAYQRCYADEVGSFPPRNSLHLNVLRDLLSLRDAILHSQYVWGMRTNQYIRSPKEKPVTRLISKTKLKLMLEECAPTFQDRILQEVLLMTLEPVLESRFSHRSFAFRPGRNAHTVIRTIRSNFAAYLWFLKADLGCILEKLDVDSLVGFLGNAVKDRKVLALVKSAIRAPVRAGIEEEDDQKKKRKKKKSGRKKKKLDENERKPDPYWLRTFFAFAPEEAEEIPSWGHGGVLCPLLANACLHELDVWMEEEIIRFFRPSRDDSIWKNSDGNHNPSWPEFVPTSGREKTKKMDYIRYGDHILIGIRGAREDAVEMKRKLIEFCERKYGLRIESSSIQIEHVTRGIEFLDHIICRRVIYPTLRYTGSGGKIISEKGVGTLLSVTASLQQCTRQFRRLQLVKGDKDPEPLPCTPMLYASQAHTNSQMNKFLETMAEWYRYADNRKKVVGFCAYIIRSSLAKLYAARYRLKSRAKVYKLASRDLSRPIKESSTQVPEYSDLLRMGLVDAIDGVQFSHMSMIPSCDYTPFPRNWMPDHERLLHEYIRLQDPKFFCELSRSIKREGLNLPQENLSMLVWDYKSKGILGRRSRQMKDANNLAPWESASSVPSICE